MKLWIETEFYKLDNVKYIVIEVKTKDNRFDTKERVLLRKDVKVEK